MSFFNNFLIVKEDRTQLCLQVSWLDAIISWLKVPDFTSVSRSNAPGDMLLSHFELVLKFRVATPLSLDEANHCEVMVITYRPRVGRGKSQDRFARYQVRSLHHLSYFAPNINYFALCCTVKYYLPLIFKDYR